MKTAIPALAAAILLVPVQPAEAGFLKKLLNTAVQAATDGRGRTEDLATQLVGEAIDAASRPRQKRDARGSAPAEAPVSNTEPAPAPKNAGLPSDIKPSEQAARQAQAFLEFSRYDCSDCEGGHGYDAWARQILNLRGDHEWEEKVGALPVGGSIQWQGKVSDGALSLVGEAEVEGLRCRQVRYMLMRRSDHQLAERDGLFCFGRPDHHAAAERWVEVY